MKIVQKKVPKIPGDIVTDFYRSFGKHFTSIDSLLVWSFEPELHIHTIYNELLPSQS